MSDGFSLVEVIVALVVFQFVTLGMLGTLVVSSRAMTEAEALERTVAEVEGIVDSLAGVERPVGASRSYSMGEVRWRVGSSGQVEIVSVALHGDTLLRLRFEGAR